MTLRFLQLLFFLVAVVAYVVVLTRGQIGAVL
jgi:hypothetical protein